MIDCYDLIYAARRGDLQQVRELVEKYHCDVNIREALDLKTPLHLAAEEGHLNMIKFLVEHGADVHARDNEGQTPLHYAAKNGHLEIVQYILQHGADVNAKDKWGDTPLHLAAQNGHLDIVQYLVKHGADVNMQDKKGKIPLDLAEEKRRLPVVKYLIQVMSKSRGVADVLPDGRTIIDFALEEGDLGLLEALLKKRYNIT